ncbi:outer membrane protein assembly factor BamA [Candidatus Vallotiella sp. (ex Adelges kitamiensis)]|uniref:outer membrane protein assembly factor BamA n=1 Tax=Candidatus Vallotiella sp. (ex Adelges kitamiensis) TaxID=2864217 RepID=UPI001CE29845|nr:outer membrane protein assembly factor BamA [Candidatus Vallotia sp. (ex Adelges kitamiensis)]
MFKHYRFVPKLVAAALFSTCGIVAHAAVPFVVQDIRLQGLRWVEPGIVFAYLPIKKGDMFTHEKGSKVIHALYATGFFSDVRVLVRKNTLVVNVQERPLISSISFDGIHKFYTENLIEILRSVGLSNGRYYDEAQLEKAKQELKRQYLVRGHHAAEIRTTVQPIDIDHNRISILFSIVEGPRAKIRQINFIGNKIFSTSILRNEMQLSTSHLFSWYTRTDLYLKEKFTRDLEKIYSYYLNQGYFEFQIDSTQASISPNKKDIYLTIVLHEGHSYKVSCINLSGNLLNKRAELERLVQLRQGDQFSIEKLQVSTTAIIQKLGEYGYAFANVEAQQNIDREHHTVKLILHVDPSRRVYVRRVNITGNHGTHDEVIRREIQQFESSWFDNRRLILSQDRINRLGYFTDVKFMITPVKNTNDQVDIDLKVIEKSTGAATLAAGCSSTDKMVILGGVSQESVHGFGKSLSLNFNTARSYRELSFTHINPYFTIDGIKKITNVYYRTYQPLYFWSDSDFQIITAGSSLKFGIPFSEANTIYFSVGAEQNRVNMKSSSPKSYIDYIKKFGYISNNIPITFGWSYDTRDNTTVPSRGYYMQVNAEYGTPLDKIQYCKTNIQVQHYYSFSHGLILGLNFRGGYGKGLSKQPYPIFKNYFSGGIGSVRGYKPNSLGPQDTITGNPTGGSTMMTGSIELMFPVPGISYNRTLHAFTFLDSGNVWNTGNSNLESNSLRYSYGLGLEWISPFGPLRLSLGLPLIKRSGDQYQELQFQFGTAF